MLGFSYPRRGALLRTIKMKRVGYKLYRSKAWQKIRAIYLSEHPWCERCACTGIVRPATQVHHKVWLNEQNINDPNIALASENLEALCDVCHAREHHSASEVGDGFWFDGDGDLHRYPQG